jgi:epoxyqueuosine reductase
MGDWVFGCDVCQDVCPWNRARPAAPHAEFEGAAGVGRTVDLQNLLALDDAAFRARFRGTALLRTKRRGLLRNAAVALGNLGDRAAIPTLRDALRDPEPLVRSHAAWALGRLAPLDQVTVDELRGAAAREVDPEAREEMFTALGSAC